MGRTDPTESAIVALLPFGTSFADPTAPDFAAGSFADLTIESEHDGTHG